MRLVVAGAGLLVLLHFVLHVGFGFEAGAPDLATLGVLIAARELRTGSAAALGFVIGLLEDALNDLAFGAGALAMTMVAVAGSRSRDLFVGDSITFVLLYLFTGKWVRDLIQWVITAAELREPFERSMLIDSTIAAVYLSLVGLALVRAFGSRDEGGAS